MKLASAVFCRLLLNTARRFPYPFAPELSRGMNVPLTAVTSILAANQATGFFGLFFGPAADRFGYRVMMLAGLCLLVAGMLAAALFPVYGMVFAGLALAGLGKNVFDPALQAYAGQRVPFERRALVIGLLEVSWAGSTLIGIPLVGIMMENWGWRSPFFAISALGIVGIFLLAILGRGEREPAATVPSGGFRVLLKGVFRQKASVGMLGFSFFVSAANDNLFVIYGAWFETSFDMSLVALGFGTAVIGAAELAGEFLTAFASDRIGLKRAVLAGAVVSACCYLLLPFCGGYLPFALAGLFLVFLTYEFTIVSSLSLCTELLPQSRATMMSGFLAASGMGRVAGALLGGPLWVAFGIPGVAAASAVSGVLSAVFFVWGMREWK